MRRVKRILAAVSFVAACSEPTAPQMPAEPPERRVRVEEVVVTPLGSYLLVGESFRFRATARQMGSCPGGWGGRVPCLVPLTEGVTFTWASSDPNVATVSEEGVEGDVRGIAPGSATITATATAGLNEVQDAAEVRVAESFVPISAVSTSASHTCGIGTNLSAYCVGLIDFKTVGNDLDLKFSWRRVPGGLALRSVTSGNGYACGITTSGQGYCWGNGARGVLSTTTSEVPQPIAGDLAFASLSASKSPGSVCGLVILDACVDAREPLHTCGVTTSGDGYCWGANNAGQLGTDSAPDICILGSVFAFQSEIPCSHLPIRVGGGLSLTAVSAGAGHTCGLTQTGETYCWGANGWGQLGDNTTASSSQPVLVSGGLAFTSVSAGADHSCGLTADGKVYCWGRNDRGQLGAGSVDEAVHPAPEAVSGGLTFRFMDAAGFACGIAIDDATYCWGGAYPPLPTKVTGEFRFTSLSVGPGQACAIPPDGRPRCWDPPDGPSTPIPGPLP
jgi:hypothetical protein